VDALPGGETPALAENLLKRATDLAPTSGPAWGASALLNHYFYSRAYDWDRQRLVRSEAEAEKALRLEPRNADALLALGLHRQALGQSDRARDYLDRALAADPQNSKVILAQSLQISDHPARAKFLLGGAARAAQPAELFYYASVELLWTCRFEEAAAACDRAIAAQPFWRTFVQRAAIERVQTANPAKINAWLDKVPELKRDEPRVAVLRAEAAILQRDGATAARVLTGLAADYLEDNFYTGPRSFLLAQAYELAGQPERAAEQWPLADRTVREKLAARPDTIWWRSMLAVILTGEHRPAEAKTIADACMADERLKPDTVATAYVAQAYIRLGELPQAIAALRTIPGAAVRNDISAATLAADPRWDALRNQAGYAELVEEMRRAENGSPGELASSPVPDQKSVAVLAFANLSEDKANEYFSDGISEELLTVLQKIPGLHVAARTSSFSFKGKDATAQEIGAKLGVANLVEGSVQKSGSRVKVSVHLSRAATGEEIWSESYTRELKDVFALQEELTQAIVGELRGQLTGGDNAAIKAAVKGGTTNAEAFQQYLQGRYYANRHAEKPTNEAISYFQRAVDLDPSFALAWAGLAETHVWLCEFSDVLDRKGFELHLGLSRAAVDRALALEPKLPEGLLARALIQFNVDYDWKGAAETLRMAQTLAPADPAIVTALGNLASARGEDAQAIAQFRHSVELDPVNPVARSYLAFAYVTTGQFADAEVEYTRLAELNPTAPWAYAGLGLGYLLQGKFEQATVTAQNDAAEWARLLVMALARFGEKRLPEADAALAQLTAKFADTAAYQIAEVHAYRGDRDRAFEWLERARQQRDGGILGLQTDPLMANLRTDPRWAAFLRQLGLAADQLK
jgi:TolB-like protein/Flp pilus assembly protein TadD